MVKPTEEIARLGLYNISPWDVPYTFVGPFSYGYVETLPMAFNDVSKGLKWFAESALPITAKGVSWSPNVRVRATGNVSIASELVDGASINGVTLQTGMLVFLGLQTDPAQNGIYTVVASGAASRAAHADDAAELALIAFLVTGGVEGSGEQWTLPLKEDEIVVGTTELDFVLFDFDSDGSLSAVIDGGNF
ncbi:MAG: hypothetical protein M9944_08090 [Rhizobiaceae bacterium]|nr:hypothetical protein [Rhizobiaceae bacterium]